MTSTPSIKKPIIVPVHWTRFYEDIDGVIDMMEPLIPFAPAKPDQSPCAVATARTAKMVEVLGECYDVANSILLSKAPCVLENRLVRLSEGVRLHIFGSKFSSDYLPLRFP